MGRRPLLLGGAVTCMVLHYAIAGVMATYGRPVDEIDGNKNLRWEIGGAPGKAVISLSYIFVGVYGFTWVRIIDCRAQKSSTNDMHRPPPHGSMPPRSSR
jgi:hypothetical protein